MTNRIEPEIPSITLDNDQVESFKSNRTNVRKSANTPADDSHSSPQIIAKQSGFSKFALFLIYIALAGASYWFYLENEKLKTYYSNAEQRIAQLEDQLSATGEEIGESSVAMKAKLEALTEKSNELWNEMDKLWASAWRRNQSEIKELRAKNIAQDKADTSYSARIKANNTSIKEVKDKQTETGFTLDAISEQVAAAGKIKADLDEISKKINSLNQKFVSRDNQQVEVATNINQLDTSLQILVERIEQLENQVKTQSAIKPAGQ